MKIKILTLVAIVMGISSAAWAQNVSSTMSAAAKMYSLEECILMGIENNFDIKISKISEQITERNVTWGNAGLLPTLEVVAAAPGEIVHNTGDFAQYGNLTLDLSWTIFDGMQAQATYARLKELHAVGELQTRMAIETLVSNIASVYYSVVRQIIRQTNLKDAVDLSHERLEIVQARYELGSASMLELKQAQVDYNADYSAYIKQIEELYQYQVELNKLVSKPSVETPLRLRDRDINFLEMEQHDAIWQSVTENNSYLLATKYDRTISYQDLRIAKAASYPSLTLSGSYGYGGSWYNPAPLTRSDEFGLSYGATLTIPIFNAGNNLRSRRNAQSELDIAELEIESMELSLKSDLSQLWMAYTNNRSIIDLEVANVATARDYLDIAIERYKLGDLSGIELREAQNSLLEAEESLSIASYDTKISEISLLLLSGTIIERLVE